MPDVRALVFVALLASAAVATAQGKPEDKSNPLMAALVLYRENRLTDALPLFVRAAAADSTDPSTLAWLAETLRRLEHVDRAIPIARRALDHAPCNAFAHEVLAAAYNPQYGAGDVVQDYDSVWAHLRRAVQCDPDDGNAWLSIWGEALRRGDRTTEERSLRRLKESGFFTRTALSYNTWLLRDLPLNAVILSNGDLDTYPALALQLADGLRRDVAVVNRPMLNLWWYAVLVHARYGLPLPDSARLATRPMCGSGGADTICLERLVLAEWRRWVGSGRLARPLAVVNSDDFPDGPGDFVRAGAMAVLRPRSESFVDTATTRVALRGIEGRDFAGPVVSAQDRSAIRISSAAQKGMSLHVAWTADMYGRELMRARRMREARDILEWLRRFERDAILDTPAARDLLGSYQHDLDAAGREP